MSSMAQSLEVPREIKQNVRHKTLFLKGFTVSACDGVNGSVYSRHERHTARETKNVPQRR